LISRVCGPDYATSCIMNIVGDCDKACDTVDATDGFFSNCHNAVRDAGGAYPAGTVAFSNSVTVFRQ
jgi:hypothetical protein